jgi:PAS domain-containing protein
VSEPLGTPGAPKSLPLILARELASNLATPMFLLDAGGMLVFYNDAAAMLLGKPFAELGEIPSGEFGAALELATPDGRPLRRRDSPSGVAFFEHRPAHMTVRRAYEATAYPLLGLTGEMHGVVAVFWDRATEEHRD